MGEGPGLDRVPINRLALVSFDGIEGAHPVMVRDISAFGACISAPFTVFASELELSFDGFRRTFLCRVVWRKEKLCGVSFVSHRDYGKRWTVRRRDRNDDQDRLASMNSSMDSDTSPNST